jgi:NAD(P)H-flavin reductase
MKGNTRRLAASASITSSAPSTSIFLEGPYGHSAYLPELRDFGRILLIAGGVGATYIIPLWKHISLQRLVSPNFNQKTQLVWAVRSVKDTVWSTELLKHLPGERFAHDELDIYVTGNTPTRLSSTELSEVDSTAGNELAREIGFNIKQGKPDLNAIVNDTFSSFGGPIAVFVCGPEAMTRQLRDQVGRWVKIGRHVYWHAEEFGL